MILNGHDSEKIESAQQGNVQGLTLKEKVRERRETYGNIVDLEVAYINQTWGRGLAI